MGRQASTPVRDARAYQHELVLLALERLGEATSAEVGELEPDLHNAHARCADLKTADLAEDTGRMKYNASGRKGRIIRLTPSGELAAKNVRFLNANAEKPRYSVSIRRSNTTKVGKTDVSGSQ